MDNDKIEDADQPVYDQPPQTQGAYEEQAGYPPLSDGNNFQSGVNYGYLGGILKQPRKSSSLVLKIVIPIAALFIILCAAAICWRTVAISVLGNKNYLGLIVVQNAASQLGGLSGTLAQQKPQFNSYDIKDKIQLGSGDNAFTQSLGVFGADASKILADSTFEIKYGKNIQKKSLEASLVWQYKGSNLITGQGYTNSDIAVFNLPELLKKSFYIKSGDVPGSNSLFDLSDKLATQTNESIDKKDLANAMGEMLNQGYGAIGNKNVTISRGDAYSIEGTIVKCDKIVVTLTQDEVKAALQRMLKSANGHESVRTLANQYKPFAQALSALSAESAASGGSGKTPAAAYDYAGLSKLIDSLNTGSITMTVLVKNGIISSEIVSCDIKDDKGLNISYYSLKGKGSLEIMGQFGADGSLSDCKMNYTNTSSSFSGTLLLPKAGELVDKASDGMKFFINKKVKTGLGYYASKIDLISIDENVKYEFSAEISNDSGKTKLVTDMKAGGQEQLTQTMTIAGSKDVMDTLPGFDPNSGIDVVTEQSKLTASSIELGTNLIAISQKLGINLLS